MFPLAPIGGSTILISGEWTEEKLDDILNIHRNRVRAWWTVRFCFSDPRSARRVPQTHREHLSETVFEPEARFPALGEARNGWSSRALRGVLSLVPFFARAKKGTRPRCGEPQLAVHHRRSRFDKELLESLCMVDVKYLF